MSLGYAERLSYREDVGIVGLPELHDSDEDTEKKVTELAKLIEQSKKVVAFTGAGISTSCQIPDFRGPNGIWTLQKRGDALPKAGVPFAAARPGLTHMALEGLHAAGIVTFVISQNVDGLHLRSGIPRRNLAELHGNCFREVCRSCGREYVRDFEIETIGLKPTGRRCKQTGCRGHLRDSVLDWEDELPVAELQAAQEACSSADLVLCLGTSLRVTPASNIPFMAIKNGGRVVIVNLQKTPKDKKAAVLIRAPVDKVMRGIMQRLHQPVPPYVRVDHLAVRTNRASKSKQATGVQVESVHGPLAPLPLVELIQVTYVATPTDSGRTATAPPKLEPSPYDEKAALISEAKIAVRLGEGAECTSVCIRHPLLPETKEDDMQAALSVHDLQATLSVHDLQAQALEENRCGMWALTGKTPCGAAIYSIVTAISTFE